MRKFSKDYTTAERNRGAASALSWRTAKLKIRNKKQRASLALTIDEGQGRKGPLVAYYLY